MAPHWCGVKSDKSVLPGWLRLLAVIGYTEPVRAVKLKGVECGQLAE